MSATAARPTTIRRPSPATLSAPLAAGETVQVLRNGAVIGAHGNRGWRHLAGDRLAGGRRHAYLHCKGAGCRRRRPRWSGLQDHRRYAEQQDRHHHVHQRRRRRPEPASSATAGTTNDSTPDAERTPLWPASKPARNCRSCATARSSATRRRSPASAGRSPMDRSWPTATTTTRCASSTPPATSAGLAASTTCGSAAAGSSCSRSRPRPATKAASWPSASTTSCLRRHPLPPALRRWQRRPRSSPAASIPAADGFGASLYSSRGIDSLLNP